MTNIFDKINDKEKDKLLRSLEAVTIKVSKNDSIFSKITKFDLMHDIAIIDEGCIQIIQLDHDGGRTILERLKKGHVFGYLLSSFSEECDIEVKEDLVFTLIDVNKIVNFASINATFSQLMKNIFIHCGEAILARNEHIKILSNRGIRNKLLAYFTLLYQKNKNRTFVLPFSFTDLADYLGIDRSAMTREINYLKQEKFIEVKGKTITLLYK